MGELDIVSLAFAESVRTTFLQHTNLGEADDDRDKIKTSERDLTTSFCSQAVRASQSCGWWCRERSAEEELTEVLIRDINSHNSGTRYSTLAVPRA